ncbi:PP2C family protein-serine/threonine phosphatase [Isoptericola variabilis]|uniref:PP2C family protein-serine/threonine phosphatase n=1 Tax=Isoptericola variabilis TaxID=139208 RepID=UPI001E3E7497|nr:PP2C family protein-serine/threonine phosphatase [Isoptericola variabilis]
MQIEGTVAGRAFRALRTVEATVDGRPCLWVPVIDGVERIGVLRVVALEGTDLDDPELRRTCWWITHLLGHLVTVLDAYGDGLDALRRRRPRTTEAELVWSLLPPLTAGTDAVVVAGRLEPAYEVGGDVFDYALGPTSASFVVLDATGHDLAAGLASAAGLAAYRNARRNGKGLFEQAESVHRTLEAQFGGSVYATAVFGELDTTTGRLRYLVAGHPSPLVMRRGHVVKKLASGRRPLLGLEMRTGVTLGEEHLEPGDTIVLYTDGIPEARDAEGRTFGLPRLVDVLERESAQGIPLPEIVDRLVRAVMQHQDDVLQDDATLLLVQWTTEGQALLEPGRAR